MKQRRWWHYWIGALLLAGPPMLAAQQASRDEVQQQLAAIREEINGLQRRLEQARTTFQAEQRSLRSLDLQIQANARELRALDEKRRDHERELQQREQERSAYLDSLADRREALGEQIIAAYQLGRESRLKLLLNQDEPGQVSRMMAYYDYLSQAHAGKIGELQEALQTLDRIQQDIDRELLALNEVEAEYRDEAESLAQRRAQRLTAAESLAAEIESDAARLAELEQNRADLETLLEGLRDALADIPATLGEVRGIAELRGQLPMPVSGRVLHAYGQQRVGGLNWQGWLISAESGAEARAVAYGRVAYADWLRGYGLLMIIDHGDGFMSLYGHNESLLFEAGDWVQPGTVISTVGSNSGSGQGLYFELRRDGRAIDPAAWMRR